MQGILSKYSNETYALVRIVSGFLFAFHGAQKVLGLFGGVGGESGAAAPLISLMGLAGIVELVGGLLIAVGLLTSWAAFISSGQMAVAYFVAHLASRIVADPEQGRVGRHLRLCLSVHRGQGRRNLEPRQEGLSLREPFTVRGESPASTETVPAPAGPGATEGAYREYVSR